MSWLDDGIATGAIMLSDEQLLTRNHLLKEPVIVEQVAPREMTNKLNKVVEKAGANTLPEPFISVGQFHQDILKYVMYN